MDGPVVVPEGDVLVAEARRLRAAGDFEGALAHFLKAVSLEHGDALWELGRACDYGELLQVHESPERAVDYFRRGAVAGCPYAMIHLASKLHQGLGCQADEEQSRHWVDQLRARDMLDDYCLALLHYRGLGGEPADHERSMVFYRRAADRGLPAAEFVMAILLYEDHRAESAAYYLRCARAGLGAACWRYARMLEKGDGVTEDATAALYWHGQAAKQLLLPSLVRVMESHRDNGRYELMARMLVRATLWCHTHDLPHRSLLHAVVALTLSPGDVDVQLRTRWELGRVHDSLPVQWTDDMARERAGWDRAHRIFRESNARCRAVAVAVLARRGPWFRVLRRDLTTLLARMVWARRCDPSVWGVELATTAEAAVEQEMLVQEGPPSLVNSEGDEESQSDDSQ